MDFSRLEKNLSDVVTEQQAKLGYRRETIRLYYPLSSLNRFLCTQQTPNEMMSSMAAFCEREKDHLGTISVTKEGERFCLILGPEVSEYIDLHTKKSGLIFDLVEVVTEHDVPIERIKKIFERYSDHVYFEKMNNGEFDYLMYFEDGSPDDYRYCFTEEGHHIIYHRYTKEDYEEFGF